MLEDVEFVQFQTHSFKMWDYSDVVFEKFFQTSGNYRTFTSFVSLSWVTFRTREPFEDETYGFYESHFINESRVEDIIETIVEVSSNLKCQYGF